MYDRNESDHLLDQFSQKLRASRNFDPSRSRNWPNKDFCSRKIYRASPHEDSSKLRSLHGPMPIEPRYAHSAHFLIKWCGTRLCLVQKRFAALYYRAAKRFCTRSCGARDISPRARKRPFRGRLAHI